MAGKPRPVSTYAVGGETFTHHRLKQSVYLEGYDELLKILRPPDALLAAPWKHAMDDLAAKGEVMGKAAAPVGTRSEGGRQIKRGKNKGKTTYAHPAGLLKSKVYGKVMKGAFPKWAAIRSRAKRHGYDYPRLLNYAQSIRHKRFSYNNVHVGWFDRGVIEKMLPAAQIALNDAADRIAEKWGS